MSRESSQESEGRSQKAASAAGLVGEVVELLPSAGYRLKLEDDSLVTAHAAGALVKNFVRLRAGDRVRVELAPRDRTRGRITELL